METEITTLNSDVDNLIVQTTGQTYTLSSGTTFNNSANCTSLNTSNIGVNNSVINIGGLTSQIYINGFLCSPINQSKKFNQW